MCNRFKQDFAQNRQEEKTNVVAMRHISSWKCLLWIGLTYSILALLLHCKIFGETRFDNYLSWPPNQAKQNHSKQLSTFDFDICRGGSKPGSGIIFLKPPKCGGTTVSLVLARVAWKNGLKIASPWNIRRGNQHTFDMWIDHSPYNKQLFRFVPASRNQFVGMVRDPGTRFRSAWTWRKDRVRLGERFGRKNNCTGWDGCTFKAFKSEAVEQTLRDMSSPLALDKQAHWQTGCSQKRCLLENGDRSNLKIAVSSLISNIKRGRYIFLVMERMEESLILLRYAFNLSLDDIVSFPKNVNSKGHSDGPITDHALEISRKLQHFDSQLYEAANETLTSWIQNCIGEEVLIREMEELKNLTRKYKEMCSKTNLLDYDKENCENLQLDWKSWNTRFGPNLRMYDQNKTTTKSYKKTTKQKKKKAKKSKIP